MQKQRRIIKLKPAIAVSNRREFLSTIVGAACVGVFFPYLARSVDSPTKGLAGSSRKKIVILATEVRKHSHAQHFIDRFLEGYGWQGAYYRPRVELAGLYVDQFPDNDLSRERSRRRNVPIFPSVAEALTLGGSKLAVDGVLIIAEHGQYPRNEKGQTLYPRYKFFKETVAVFEASGRSVPVFNDKHLSTNWSEAVEMVGDAGRLGFPFMAGSSLPVTRRIPSTEITINTRIQESVCVCYGGVDSYDFHGLETAQCMSERRRGGETGVRSVQAVRGDKLWQLLQQRDSTRQLLFAALARSHSCKAPAEYTISIPTIPWIRDCSPNAVAYFIEHQDGFQTAMFLLNGFVNDFTYAGLVRESEKVISCQMNLPMPSYNSTTADFFNPLVYHIERMVISGRASYPVERTLLTTGMTLSAVESLHQGEIRLATPELRVAYHAPTASKYWDS